MTNHEVFGATPALATRSLQLTKRWLSDRSVVPGTEVGHKLQKVFSDETLGMVTMLPVLESGSMATSTDSQSALVPAVASIPKQLDGCGAGD